MNDNFPIVLVCPISHSTTNKTPYCVKVSDGELQRIDGKSWIRTSCIFPIEKSYLEARYFIGHLPGETLDLVKTRILQLQGFLDESTE